MKDSPPNIIWIMTDQLRFDCLGCSGHKHIKTPNIDALSQQSVQFENTYAPSATCAPARAAIFSGKYPPGNGVIRNWLGFRDNTSLLPELLKEKQYYTANIGKLHFAPHSNNWGFDYKVLNDGPIGIYCKDDQRQSDYSKYLMEVYGNDKAEQLLKEFDEYESQWYGGSVRKFILGAGSIPEEHDMTTWTVNHAIDFLDNYDKSDPLFLHLSFFGPHQPWLPPGKWRDMYDPNEIELPEQFYEQMQDNPIFAKTKAELRKRIASQISEQDFKQLLAYYYGNISMLDYYIGKVLDKLKSKGLWDNTLIIFTSDHGDHNGSYGLFFKSDLYDSCAKVPLIVKKPNGNKTSKSQAIVNTLDIYGTILDYAGFANWDNDDIEAKSLYPVLEDLDTTIPHQTFSIMCANQDSIMTMLREDNLKLIRLKTKSSETLYELYDMNESPIETRNIFLSFPDKPKLNSLKEKLDNWSARQIAKCNTNTKDYAIATTQ